MMAVPPVDGAVQASATDVLPKVAVSAVGAFGTVAGISAEEFALYVPVPAKLTAATRNR